VGSAIAHPSLVIDDGQERGRRIRPTRVAPVAIFLREDASWLLDSIPQSDGLSQSGRDILDALRRRGASFLPELAKATGLLTSQVEDGLWELAAAGLVTADGFENLRALVDPKRAAVKEARV
jgi:ATP-dependent Lhr-like helicase